MRISIEIVAYLHDESGSSDDHVEDFAVLSSLNGWIYDESPPISNYFDDELEAIR